VRPLVHGARYWGSVSHFPPAGYDRLPASLLSGGFVSPGTDHDVAVHNDPADGAIAEDPPPLQ
jgi:hypothetical protein